MPQPQAPAGFETIEQFIDYCEAHSETKLAHFHFSHVAALLRLAGRETEAMTFDGKDGFKGYDLTDVCTQARDRLRSPEVDPLRADYIKGHFSDRIAAGQRPDHGYPDARLPRPTIETMTVSTSFLLGASRQ